MANLVSDAPDPRTFQSWEDAFKFPVPAVRRMEQQLRSDVSGNKERLRTLVGASYRELLGTAESIVQMDKQMRDAESHLSSISQRCNTRNLEKAKMSAIQIRQRSIRRDLDLNAHVSHLALLKECPAAILSLLKAGKSLRLAAKVLVLSRLLHKKAASEFGTAPFADTLRVRLGKIRMRLLSVADQRLANLSLEASVVIDAMSAYSLATNSSCTDVLQHFHQVRLGAISTSVQNQGADSEGAIIGLQLWIRTIQDTQSLFPRQISRALDDAKSKPLLEDENILDIQELDFDTHSNFIDEDIKYFTPYIRHDDLTISTAAEMLTVWSPMALKVYADILQNFLRRVEDFATLLTLRKDCLHQFVSSKMRSVGFTKSEGLDVLRRIFQDVLRDNIKELAENVSTVVEALRDSLAATGFASQMSKSLWANDLVDMELSDGAKRLTGSVRARVLGQSAKHDQILQVYTTWLTNMNASRASLQELKSKKWTIEELDDEEEDVEDIEDMRYRLEKEDPDELDNVFQTALRSSISSLETEIDQICSTYVGGPDAGPKATFILRLLREIKETSPDGIRSSEITFAVVVKLQRAVAQPIIQSLIDKSKASIMAATKHIKIPVRLLWDGLPEHPIVPSPWSFMLLKTLHQSMTLIGLDIWTTSAVGEVQSMLEMAVASILTSSAATDHTELGILVPSQVNGDHETSQKSQERDAKIQLLFDVEYIRVALSTNRTHDDGSLKSYCASVIKEFEITDEFSRRLAVAANEYWKRTHLLFGLLA